MINLNLPTQYLPVLDPLLNEPFDSNYKIRKGQWEPIFTARPGIKRRVHQEPVFGNFGSAPEVPDATPMPFDQSQILYIANYYYKYFGLAFGITQSMIDDGEHIEFGQILSGELGKAMIDTKEILTANILNRATNASYPGGDGQPLASASHPGQNGATYSNLLTQSALSATSLENAIITVSQAQDNRGRYIDISAVGIVVPSALQLQAEVLLKSMLRPGSANNDVFTAPMHIRENDPFIVTRLTSATAWGVTTTANTDPTARGLQIKTRGPVRRGMEGDFISNSLQYKAIERYIPGWTDPRALYWNQAA